MATNISGAPTTLLFEAKLLPVTVADQVIARPRLALPATLVNGDSTVLSVVAPAGYGKTTLLAQWWEALPSAGISGAWLSLDEGDHDGRCLLAHLIAALRTRQPQFGQHTLEQLTRATGETLPATLLAALAQDLAQLPQRLMLFLDDVHALHDAEALRILTWLINYAPGNLQFILAARQPLHLRLSGLRLRGRLLEYEQRQLNFDFEEVGRFYRARLKPVLSAHELMQLLEKTEGWAAGLQLAALALAGAQGEQQRAALIDAFTGTDLALVDYLGEVVLRHLDVMTQEFLYLVAQFDRINGALAAVISGLPDADQRLAGLQARGLFLEALDRRGEWYRFHPLVGEFLRRRPPSSGPSAKAALTAALLRGAHWLHDQGWIEAAIDAAVRAQDWRQVCLWLSEQIEAMAHSRGWHRPVLRWVRAIPALWLDRYPRIQVHYAFSLAFSLRPGEAEQQLARLDEQLATLQQRPAVDAQIIAELSCAIALQRIMLAALRDEGQWARDAARDWLLHWPQAALVQRGSVENALAFGHKCCGEMDAGLAMVAQARQTLTRGQHYYGLAWNFSIEALLHMKQGHYAAARADCQQGLQLLCEHLAGGGAQSSLFHVLLAAVSYEFDELADASEHMERGSLHLEEVAPTDWLILADLTQARLLMHAGDAKGGFAALHLGQMMARTRGLRRLELTLVAEEVTWLCRREQLPAALAVAERHAIADLIPSSRAQGVAADKALRLFARLRMAEHPDQVVAALERALHDARQRALAHREVELSVLQVAALHAQGASGAAQALLEQALHLGRSRAYRRVFIDDAELLRPLLVGKVSVAGAWLRDLLQPVPSVPRQQESLTRRELAILQRLQSGLNNREIAESLFVSEGTLKWHLHNIYGKLAVRNRAGALSAAQRNGLLS